MRNNSKLQKVLNTLSLMIFLLIPLTLFVFNVHQTYNLYYYIFLTISILIYAALGIGHTSTQSSKKSTKGKLLIGISFVNLIILSLIQLTGNLQTPYFFLLYFLLFIYSFFATPTLIVLEIIVVFLSLFSIKFHAYDSFHNMRVGLTFLERVRMISLVISTPIIISLSRLIQNLKQKKKFFEISQDLLEVQDIEDETLLSEIDQGVIVVDQELTIVKVSKWIEDNFGITADLFLNKNFKELTFYDAVSNKKIKETDYFYKNLKSRAPQTLNWRVLYKNQYGKYKKFVIKQNPLIVKGKLVGFLLSFKYPPKSLTDIISSFNRLLNFKISSNIGMIKNLLSTDKKIQTSENYKLLKKHIKEITKLLNDASIKNNITEGHQEITITKFDLNTKLKNEISQIQNLGASNIWNISPIYKNKEVLVKSDSKLCSKLLEYTLKGCLYLTKNQKIQISIDESQTQKAPTLTITANDIKAEVSEKSDLIEPFFGGKLVILSKYKGTGLELSNANLIANFLGFDYEAQVEGKSVTAKIIFLAN